MKRRSLANFLRSAGVIPFAALALSLFSFQNSSQAQIVLSVTGGTGGTPLIVSITTGATFTANANSSTFTGVFFDNLFNGSNTVEANSISGGSNNIELNNTTEVTGTYMGVRVAGSTDVNDLYLEWVTGVTSGNNVVLGTGTRVSGDLSLTYSSLLGGMGNAFLMTSVGNAISPAITYTVVPEPSTYAAVSGALLVGMAAFRRRTLARA